MTPREEAQLAALKEIRCPNVKELMPGVWNLADEVIERCKEIKDGKDDRQKQEWLVDMEEKYCGHDHECPVSKSTNPADGCECYAYAFRALAVKLRESYGMKPMYF